MKYDFNKIEAKWQEYWATQKTFEVENTPDKPKYYVLDMFPYPSGAGLHVGHPLGYIASDIYARYKRHRGFNVLHPMGYDSFGLPAEQYAIQTGQHPRKTTEININGCLDDNGIIKEEYVLSNGDIKDEALVDKNEKTNSNTPNYQKNVIKGYQRQLNALGFSFDWSRRVRTSDPEYYKWTQWIFIQLFNSWYNTDSDKAEGIKTLISKFESEGNAHVNAVSDDDTPVFTAEEWKAFSPETQQRMLLKYRLTYLAETEVNWCPALGTVLANDEVVNGASERGGHPVIRKKMTQWSMRISAYSDRLLYGLDTIDWPEPLKEMQRHWIGRSAGAEIQFKVRDSASGIDVFTTRPDTIFGASFMVLAPEHELVDSIVTDAQKSKVAAYIEATARRSERDRLSDVKTISGVFTGAYAIHPFSGEDIPIWIGDYVLASYGTGAVMAVPCGDQRDHDFATYFDIPIPNIFEGIDTSETAFADKKHTIITNSDFLNGLNYEEATEKVIEALEATGQGKAKINYRIRDAVFSRQRYWGEPFPIYYKNEIPYPIPEDCLPLMLPEVEKYLPTETGEPPLGRATVWSWDEKNKKVVPNSALGTPGIYPLELNTMPGWAGSSWYFNRYMDARNTDTLFSPEAVNYWKDVDLYIGGSEHATGHLLYARFWQHFLYDKGRVPVKEFAKKLINQGMILGESAFVYRVCCFSNGFKKFTETAEYNEHKEFFTSSVYVSKKIGELIERGDSNYIYETNTTAYLNIVKLLKQQLSAANARLGKDELKYGEVPTILIVDKIRTDIYFVNASNELDIEGFRTWRPEFKDAVLIDETGEIIPEVYVSDSTFVVVREPEKMSKSKYNVLSPDNVCAQYGADTLRMYEMFLGPLEQAKPWSTAGITGVHSFLKKLWRLYHSGPDNTFYVSDDPPSEAALKTLHKTIKKVAEDIENFSFNTSVSTFMICVNELTAQKCTSIAILSPLTVLVSPYAPHIAEELWELLGHTGSIAYVPFPELEEKYLVERSKNYPVSFNGKVRFTIELSLDLSEKAIEEAVMSSEKTQQQLQGKVPKKVIIVPGKIINIVV